jgi:hypothetical protein
MSIIFEGTVTTANPLPVNNVGGGGGGGTQDVNIVSSAIDLPIDDSTPIDVNITNSGSVGVSTNATVDTGNSTESSLAASATFTGAWTDSLDVGTIVIGVNTDQDSATDGLVIQYSNDQTHVCQDDKFTIAANAGKVFTFTPANRYYRITYTNGPLPQTSFDLETIQRRYAIKPSSHRIQDSIVNEDDAELVKAVLSAKANGGDFVNITATKSNNLRVANVEDGLSIAKGDVSGTSFVHKFGAAPDFDTVDGSVTIWDGADDEEINQMRLQYSTSADIDTVSSSSASDTFVLQLQGLGSNYELITQRVTLNGTSQVTLSTSLIRIFRMKNTGAVDNVGHIYVYVNGTATAGIPDTSADVRAVMQPGKNQTLMAVYTVPSGYTAYMRDWYASISGPSKSSEYAIELRARQQGSAFQLKHVTSIQDGGTSYVQHNYDDPERFTEKVDIEMRAQALVGGVRGASIAAGFDIVLVENEGATQVVRYVDPDATGTGDGTSWDNAYTSLSAWDAGEGADLVTADTYHTVYCRSSSGTADTTQLVLTGWTTSTRNYIEIIGDWDSGAWDATKYRMELATGYCLSIREDVVKIKKVQFYSADQDAVTWFNNNNNCDYEISQCLFRGNATRTYSAALLTTTAGGLNSTVKIWNNLFYDWTAIGQSAIYLNDADCTFYVYNNTIVNGARGLRHNASTKHYVFNNHIDTGNDDVVGTFTNDDQFCDYNYINENTTDNVLGTHGASNQTFLYTDAPADDYSPAAGSACIDNGLNITDRTGLVFTDDIEGTTRRNPWDVGAFNYV